MVSTTSNSMYIGIYLFSFKICQVVVSMHADGEGSLNLRIKTLEEKIPSSYDQLREHIELLAIESRNNLTPPIIKKDLFW